MPWPWASNLKGLFTIFFLLFKSHILGSNGVWYSWFWPEGSINAQNSKIWDLTDRKKLWTIPLTHNFRFWKFSETQPAEQSASQLWGATGKSFAASRLAIPTHYWHSSPPLPSWKDISEIYHNSGLTGACGHWWYAGKNGRKLPDPLPTSPALQPAPHPLLCSVVQGGQVCCHLGLGGQGQWRWPEGCEHWIYILWHLRWTEHLRHPRHFFHFHNCGLLVASSKVSIRRSFLEPHFMVKIVADTGCTGK